ncbi:MAG: DUF4397 domain-containing protein [Anaerolineales bacterium]|nr:DUF4397 domain-containing protein [Anaerolineales bacterium]MCB9128468.1 DUF4397 domain-containing protein [Ardenticatenales bacterium]MCB9172692.1 DUF4397 domain-containing protein [Ardenticatenales bacterium]
MKITSVVRRSRVAPLLTVALLFAFVLLLAPRAASADNPLAANVWVAHLAPFADTLPGTAVDIDITAGGSTTTLNNVQFKDSTGNYVALPPGDVGVTITPVGSTTPVIDETLNVSDNTDYTVAAIGGANGWPVELFPLVDDNTPPAAGAAKLRIGHLAPFAATSAATEVDIRLQDGSVIPGLTNVPYKGVSGYLELPAGTLDVIITAPGGSPVYLDVPPLTLVGNTVTTVFAIGDLGNQPLEVYALETFNGNPTAIALDSFESSEGGSLAALVALGIAAFGLALVVRRRRRA